jgi:hypothetical protein
MRFPGFVAGLAPWLLFLVLPHDLDSTGPVPAALTATAVAIALTIWTKSLGGLNVLTAAGAGTFAAITVAGAICGTATRQWLTDFSPATALFVLAAVMLLSVATVPFTELYARQALPMNYWGSPQLRAINHRISLVWAYTTLAAALSLTAAQFFSRHLFDKPGHYLVYTLAWLIPILLLLAAFRYTQTITRSGHSARPRSGADV